MFSTGQGAGRLAGEHGAVLRIAALIYWVFNFVVEMLLGAAEKQLDYYHD